MFEEQGIGGASIEAIAAAAGFTRGAFYSNFESKDELIIAMLEDHVEQSIQRNLDLLALHQNIPRFPRGAEEHGPQRQDPLGRSPLLHMEMILFVARAEKRRPELAKRLRARRALTAKIVETVLKNSQDAGQSRLDRRDPAGAGGRLPAASPDRSGDHASRQFRARRRRPATNDRHLISVTFPRPREPCRARPPDRERRQQAHGDADRESDRVGAGHVMQQRR